MTSGRYTEANKQRILDCVAEYRRHHVGAPSWLWLSIEAELSHNTVRRLIPQLVQEGRLEPGFETESDKQRVLELVAEYRRNHKGFPSLRLLSQHSELSYNATGNLIRQLVDEGRLDRGPRPALHDVVDDIIDLLRQCHRSEKAVWFEERMLLLDRADATPDGRDDARYELHNSVLAWQDGLVNLSLAPEPGSSYTPASARARLDILGDLLWELTRQPR